MVLLETFPPLQTPPEHDMPAPKVFVMVFPVMVKACMNCITRPIPQFVTVLLLNCIAPVPANAQANTDAPFIGKNTVVWTIDVPKAPTESKPPLENPRMLES